MSYYARQANNIQHKLNFYLHRQDNINGFFNHPQSIAIIIHLITGANIQTKI